MRKAKWIACIMLVLLIAFCGFYWKILVYAWWVVRSDSPVVWRGVEISFPERFIYIEEGGDVEKLTFGDFTHMPGTISFVRFKIENFDKSMGSMCKERGFFQGTAMLKKYGEMVADVNYCTDHPDKKENFWAISFRDAPLMALYHGPQESFVLFEPILQGV